MPCTILRPRGESYLRILLQSVAAENVGREGGETQNETKRRKGASREAAGAYKRIRPDRNAVRQGRIHLPESARHAAEYRTYSIFMSPGLIQPARLMPVSIARAIAAGAMKYSPMISAIRTALSVVPPIVA